MKSFEQESRRRGGVTISVSGARFAAIIIRGGCRAICQAAFTPPLAVTGSAPTNGPSVALSRRASYFPPASLGCSLDLYLLARYNATIRQKHTNAMQTPNYKQYIVILNMEATICSMNYHYTYTGNVVLI